MDGVKCFNSRIVFPSEANVKNVSMKAKTPTLYFPFSEAFEALLIFTSCEYAA